MWYCEIKFNHLKVDVHIIVSIQHKLPFLIVFYLILTWNGFDFVTKENEYENQNGWKRIDFNWVNMKLKNMMWWMMGKFFVLMKYFYFSRANTKLLSNVRGTNDMF